jgi:hypothetical protein
MKKYGEYLEESLALQAKAEPKSAAAKEARKMGLSYMGFGRYADRKGKLAYVVHDDRLVPYKSEDDVDSMHYKAYTAQESEPLTKKKNISPTAKGQPAKPSKAELLKKDAEFYSSVNSKRSKEDTKILKDLYKDANAVDKELFKFYQRNMFDETELQAIENYTGDGYAEINRYLYKGHDDGVSPEQDEIINRTIETLDSAFEETQTPFPYTVYSGLSSRYKADKFKLGGEYIFRGYVSTSLDFNTAIGGFADVGDSDQPVVLQVELKKGQKAIYVDAVSVNAGERETLLPRGSKIKVISGPHVLDSMLFTDAYGTSTIALFHCTVVEDS